MPTKVSTVAEYVTYWLREVVTPSLAPGSYVTYEVLCRRYILPGVGQKRIDKLQVQELQTWLNVVRRTCQCCSQGNDASRSERNRRCCAVGQCCGQVASPATIVHLRRVLRVILSQAMTDGLATRNVAVGVKLPTFRKRRRRAWTSDEARRFLESARRDNDPLYVAYVLVLVLGLRKGELLGLAWEDVNLDIGEVQLAWQLQRVGDQLVRRETKTETSDAPLPLPDICVAALRAHHDATKEREVVVGLDWLGNHLVFTTGSAHPSSRATSTVGGTPHRIRRCPSDHCPRRPPDVRFTPCWPGRASARGYADPPRRSVLDHDGDLQ
jgi:integrase